MDIMDEIAGLQHFYSDDEGDLEGDVLEILEKDKITGAWADATMIGLEAGFERRNAAARVRGVLKSLVKRGIVEEERNERPIIYRMKAA